MITIQKVSTRYAEESRNIGAADMGGSCYVADPRSRALEHQQHRSTGPTPEPLRTRGRNNHYRTKG